MGLGNPTRDRRSESRATGVAGPGRVDPALTLVRTASTMAVVYATNVRARMPKYHKREPHTDGERPHDDSSSRSMYPNPRAVCISLARRPLSTFRRSSRTKASGVLFSIELLTPQTASMIAARDSTRPL